MQSTGNRNLFVELIGAAAAAGDIVVIPATQATPGDGTASIADGFPAETFVSVSAGGKRPRGQDVNGFLNLLSAAAQFLQADPTAPYSAALSAAIGGYPLNAIVSAGIAGAFWVSTVENNTTVPGATGASWSSLFAGLALTNGSSSQVFNVSPGVTANEAINLGQFTSDLIIPGWKEYPDPNSPTGYILEQWGVASIPKNSTVAIYPIKPMYNAVLDVSICMGSTLAGGYQYSVGIDVVNATQLNGTLVTSDPGGPFGTHWRCKGF
jgi:hypothetical protein